jgi:hypothetical protein
VWRSQDDVAMDAATRLTSTPLGQVANPSFNVFFSEYFLRPDKIARLCLATDAFWMVYLFIYFFKLEDSAIYSEEETESKIAIGNRILVEF